MANPVHNHPQNEQIEISVFGPGFGECVLVHFGDRKWMVIDSCLAESRRPIALDYLERIGVDVSKDLILVVATHWHTDHVRGLAGVLREATSAQFACPQALLNKEFFELVAQQQGVTLSDGTSPTSEFRAIFDEFGSPNLVLGENTEMASMSIDNVDVRVLALSPSAKSVFDAVADITKEIATAGQRIWWAKATNPNKASVAMRVDYPDFAILLGGDLEIQANDNTRGWGKVIANHVNNNSQQSELYKVAHHGSVTGHQDEIWTELLVEEPFAALTPFVQGRVSLPNEEDIARIIQLSNRAYITAWPPAVRPKVVNKSVNRTMKEVTGKKSRRAIRKKPGQIRFRRDIRNGMWSIDLFDGARRITPKL